MSKDSQRFERTLALAGLEATEALGARIAASLKVGDAVALQGDLGAGKTTLARAILQALGVTEEVPSPTFTLVQHYETPKLNVRHYDLYRIENPAEVEELGLEEALDDGAAPDRMAGAGAGLAAGGSPAHILEPGERHAPGGGERTAALAGADGGDRTMTPERADAMEIFLAASGWGAAARTPLPGDASTRRYVRLAMNGRRAMLMDQPQSAETPPASANATPEERRTLGYNALARLAGGDVARFVAVAKFLRDSGLSAPDILAADPKLGFAIIEDLGDDLYADVLDRGGDEFELYRTAADVLAHLHEWAAPATMPNGVPLYPYDETAQLAEIDLVTDWFFPLALGRPAREDEVAEHRALWRSALDETRHAAPVFVHRDYHAQNLLWLPRRSGVARVGLIDFQDAVAGSRAQDLMHLVEDARRDVSPELAAAVKAHYLRAVAERGIVLDAERFGAEMAIIAAQRNARIVGVFSRLYKRDGKARYLAYLPRVWGYLNRDLEHPALAGLKAWYDRTIPRAKRGAPEGLAA